MKAAEGEIDRIRNLAADMIPQSPAGVLFLIMLAWGDLDCALSHEENDLERKRGKATLANAARGLERIFAISRMPMGGRSYIQPTAADLASGLLTLVADAPKSRRRRVAA